MKNLIGLVTIITFVIVVFGLVAYVLHTNDIITLGQVESVLQKIGTKIKEF
jgi:hypothetical protein